MLSLMCKNVLLIDPSQLVGKVGISAVGIFV